MSENRLLSGLRSFYRAEIPRTFRIIRKSLTPLKMSNYLRNRTSLFISKFFNQNIVWGMPYEMMFEPASVCNLRCPLCALGTDSIIRSEKLLDIELFKKILDESYKYLITALFWNQGEPFLNPRFLEMVKLASDYKIYTLASTNGHYLQEPEKIIASGLDELILSVDGATAQTFDKYRLNGNFGRVIQGIENLAVVKSKQKEKTPWLTFQFVITAQNEHEVEAAAVLANNIGCNEIMYKTAEIPADYRDSDEFYPKNPRYRRYPSRKWKRCNNLAHCERLWQQPVINSDGKVAACCFDKKPDLSPGNIIDSGIGEIWHSTEMNNIRERVKHHKSKFEPCKSCTDNLVRNFRSIVF